MENNKQHYDAIKQEFEMISNEIHYYQEQLELQRNKLSDANKDLNILLKEKYDIEEKLRQRSRLESLGLLIGGVAHNFNNALSIINSNCHMLERKIDDEQLLKYINNSKAGVAQAADLIQQLLSYSHAPAVSPVPFSLYDNIFQTCKLMRSATSRRFDVNVYRVDENDKYGVIGYPSQIQEIILNLTTNSAQATDNKGSITFTLDKVDITEDDIYEPYEHCSPGKYVRVVAADDGPGIPDDIIDKVFDSFFTTKEVGAGTGIGLATVKKIIERHQGMIFVKSDKDGATFEMYFPVSSDKTKEISNNHTIDKNVNSDYTILIVDDNKEGLDAISEIVESYGFNFEKFTNPGSALTEFQNNPEKYQLLLTDYFMPEMNGIELTGHLHTINPKLKTIIISGVCYNRIRSDIKKAYNIVDVIAKPVDYKLLLSKIKLALNL